MPTTVLTRGMRFCAMLVVLALVFVQSARADNAVVLPKGFTFFNFENRYFLPTTDRYDQDGNTVQIGADFSRNLNSQVFTVLPAGASLGTTQVNIERNLNIFRPLLAYGITDRLTAGIIIPYIWARNKVASSLNTSTATFGKSAVGAGIGFPIVPLVGSGLPDVVPLNIEDIQNLLGGGLDVDGNGTVDQAGLGLKRVQTRESEGIGDIEFGARFQYYRSDSFRAAFTGIVIAPTGKQDDPDDLLDIPLGDGNWAIRFQFQQDFLKQKDGLAKRLGFPEVGDFFINTKLEYLYNLPDNRVVRVCNPRLPVCTDKAEVTRKTGDIIEAELQGNLGVLTDGLILIGGYNYFQQLKGSFSGDTPGLPYGDLAIDTDTAAHEYIIGMTFSTVPLVIKGKFPLPLVGNVQYRDRFAGYNVFKNQVLWFTVAVYFDMHALLGFGS